MGAARQKRQREQEQRRTDRGEAGEPDFRPQPEVARRQGALALAGVMGGVIDDAKRQPGERGDERDDEGRTAWRARLQGLQDLADRGAVVVGRRAAGRQNRLGFGRFGGGRLRQRLQGRRRLQGGGRRRRRLRLERRGGQRRGFGGRGRRFGVESGGGQRRRLGGRNRRRRGGKRARRIDKAIVMRQVQGVFDRRHRRRKRILSLVLSRHRVRLTPSCLMTPTH